MKRSLFIIAIIISFIFFHQTADFDEDLGRHLQTGKIIIETKKVPSTNLFSYSHPNEPVLNHHWASQVIFYLVNRIGGINSLILLSVFVGTLSLVILLFTALRNHAPLPLALITLIPFIPSFFWHSQIRPQIFSTLFFVIIYSSIFLQSKNIKYLFPLLILFWVNLHISFLVGLFAITVILVFSIFDPKNPPPEKRQDFILLCLSYLASLFNPQGIHGVIKAITIIKKYGFIVIENQTLPYLLSANFPQAKHVLLAFAVLIVSLIMSRFAKRQPQSSNKRFLELTILVVIASLTIQIFRMGIFFATAAYLTATFNFAGFYNQHFRNRVNLSRHKLINHLITLFSLIIMFVLIHQLSILYNKPLGFGNQENYKKAVDFFLEHNLPSPILNNFAIGGYLVYRLYPQYKVFIDNRPEAYPIDFFSKTYFPLQEDPTVFNEMLKKYNFKTIIWAYNEMSHLSQAFFKFLDKNSEWHLIYSDNYTLIYVRYLDYPSLPSP